MKQKLIDGILYVYSFEPYIITEDTDAKVIYVQTELYSEYKSLNPTLTQLAKKNFNTMTVYTPEWNIYRYMPDISPSISLNSSILVFENTSIEGNTIEIEDSVRSFNLFEANDGVATQYSSSYTSVATINETGDVTINGLGTTTISAYSAGDETHEEYNKDYTLIVTEGNKQRLDSGISFSSNSVNVYYSETTIYPTLVNPNSLSVVYSTTDTEYALVDAQTGEVTILMNPNEEKELNIYATFSGNTYYLPRQIRYTISLYPRREEANISWDKQSFTANIDRENVFPQVINPDNLTLNYYSSDTSKATINLLNGNITLIEPTTEPIEISSVFSGSNTTKPKTIIYYLTIVEDEKQVTLDVEYSSTNGLVQLYGEFVEPTPVLQETLDVDYYANDGQIQLYGEFVEPIQTTLDVDYHSENGAAQLYGQFSQIEIE